MSKVPGLFFAATATLVLASIATPDPSHRAVTPSPVSTATIGELPQATYYQRWLGEAHARAAREADESAVPPSF